MSRSAAILGELGDLGLAEDTIVLFSSDHGDMLGSHGKRLKRKPGRNRSAYPASCVTPAPGRRER